MSTRHYVRAHDKRGPPATSERRGTRAAHRQVRCAAMVTSTESDQTARVDFPDQLHATLREVCEHLAPIDTTPCSPGEREAAQWIQERMRAAGVNEVALEDEPSWGSFPPTAVALGVLGLLGALLVLSGRRLRGALLGIASGAGVLDEAENGPRVARRLLRRRKTTVNVVARL